MILCILIVALVQATKEDDHIGLTGFLHGFGNEFVGRAILAQVDVHLHTIIERGGVAYIAASEVDLGVRGCEGCQSSFQTVERRNLVLHLQRRRTTAHGHGLDGILADDENGGPPLIPLKGGRCGEALELLWSQRE